jgi:hypothetical protein
MKRRRHTPEQVVACPGRLTGSWPKAQGREVPEVCEQLEISEATYHRWRARLRIMTNASFRDDMDATGASEMGASP